MYMNAITDNANATLRARPEGPPSIVIDAPAAAPVANAPDPSAATGVVIPPVATPDDPDAVPACAPPRPKTPTSPTEDPAKGSKPDLDEGPSKPQSNGVYGPDEAGGTGNGTAI